MGKKEEEELRLPSSDESDEEVNEISSNESDVSLSEDSEEESGDEEEVEIKGVEDIKNSHIVLKPSKQVKITKDKSKKGAIYVGRTPEGFQEAEIKKYFEQFGEISRLKLSRNKKTGKSKHYGFIEFENMEVAKIAAETMNNYLVFGHLLKCYVIEDPKKYDLIFNNRKFKIIPWKKISQHRNDKPKNQQHWDKLSKNFEANKSKRHEKLTTKGIDTSYLK